MHHRRCGLQAVGAVLGLGLSVCTPTHARPETAPRPPGDVTEVVVRASPGPALWRVTKGGSELVILGAISPTPAGGSWNTRPLADALRGARVLMLSPGSTPGFAWAEAFPQSRRYLLQQPFGRTLRGELDPDAATRFARMAAVLPHTT